MHHWKVTTCTSHNFIIFFADSNLKSSKQKKNNNFCPCFTSGAGDVTTYAWGQNATIIYVIFIKKRFKYFKVNVYIHILYALYITRKQQHTNIVQWLWLFYWSQFLGSVVIRRGKIPRGFARLYLLLQRRSSNQLAVVTYNVIMILCILKWSDLDLPSSVSNIKLRQQVKYKIVPCIHMIGLWQLTQKVHEFVNIIHLL